MNEAKQHFTQHEAKALRYKTFKALRGFSKVPLGTFGTVVDAEEVSGHWDIVVQWSLPVRSSTIGQLMLDDEPVTIIQINGPLRDWFTKDEVEHYLEEVK